MKLHLTINAVKTVNQLENYWTTADYINLLKEFDYEDAAQIPENDALEYLQLCITDLLPEHAAEVVLAYKLSDHLSQGQIQNLSHEMQGDKVAEDYSDPALHFDLFNINQLLYKAYNGKFPNTEASIITVAMTSASGVLPQLNKEIVVKAVNAGLVKGNIINRLYHDELSGEVEFKEAAKVIWKFKMLDPNMVEILTSKYFIEIHDFAAMEFEANIVFYEEE
jgi:hypothetical protein